MAGAEARSVAVAEIEPPMPTSPLLQTVYRPRKVEHFRDPDLIGHQHPVWRDRGPFSVRLSPPFDEWLRDSQAYFFFFFFSQDLITKGLELNPGHA